MRYSKLGGQAVIEGVMMKHEKEYSVAVRKPDGGIEVTKKATSSIRDKYKIASLPIIRGMVIFAPFRRAVPLLCMRQIPGSAGTADSRSSC